MPLQWFSDFGEYVAVLEATRARALETEIALDSRTASPGYCVACKKVVPFQVNVGVWLGEYPSLREGMRCPLCGMNNRTRLLVEAVLEFAGGRRRMDIGLLEASGPFFAAMKARFASVTGSEFFGPDHQPGELYEHRGKLVQHQDVTALSYPDATFDMFSHNDVLEHVYRYPQALAQMRRVLRPGGALIFAVPFFYDLDATLVRGIEAADGSVEHLETPEYHGDGIRDGGVYTFYHYGPDLLDAIAAAGFGPVQIGFAYDAYFGNVSNNYRYGGHGLMFPTVFRAIAS